MFSLKPLKACDTRRRVPDRLWLDWFAFHDPPLPRWTGAGARWVQPASHDRSIRSAPSLPTDRTTRVRRSSSSRCSSALDALNRTTCAAGRRRRAMCVTTRRREKGSNVRQARSGALWLPRAQISRHSRCSPSFAAPTTMASSTRPSCTRQNWTKWKPRRAGVSSRKPRIAIRRFRMWPKPRGGGRISNGQARRTARRARRTWRKRPVGGDCASRDLPRASQGRPQRPLSVRQREEVKKCCGA